MSSLEAGLTGQASVVVDDKNTAVALGSGDVPVFGTPAVVALMEQAAVNAVKDALPADKTSVGTNMSMDHKAATPVGLTVRAEAKLTAVENDGRKLTFTVTAHDDRELVAEGTHQRFVVTRDKFVQRAQGKAASQ